MVNEYKTHCVYVRFVVVFFSVSFKGNYPRSELRAFSHYYVTTHTDEFFSQIGLAFLIQSQYKHLVHLKEFAPSSYHCGNLCVGVALNV